MCLDPASMAALAAAAAMTSTVVSTVSGQQQAAAQEAMQAQASAAERQRALTETAALRQKEAQEKEAQARDAARIAEQSKKAIATARVSAGEAGASVSNTNAIIADLERQTLGYMEGVQRQNAITSTSYNLAVENAMNQSTSNLININQPVSAPSFLEIPLALAKAPAQYKATKAQLEG